MNMFKRASRAQENQVPQAEWASAEVLLDDLAETSWLFRMAQLGLGFNPDLLALAERLDEPIGTQDPALRACLSMAGAPALR